MGHFNTYHNKNNKKIIFRVKNLTFTCEWKMICNNENKKWPQFLATLTVVVANFSAGINYGWPTPSLPKLLSNSYNLTSDEASYVITVACFGDIVGNIVFTTLADILGRKTTILLIAGPQISSMLFLYLSSYSRVLLYFARFLGGVGEGACLCVIPAYIGEISEPEIRGVLISFLSISWTLGSLLVNIVGSYNTIATTSLITLTFPLLFLGTFVFAPESPYYHLTKNNVKKARRELKKLRWSNNVEEELVILVKDVERQMSEKGRFWDLVKIKSNRRALFIISLVTAVSEFSGISSLTFYAQIFFMKTTNALPESWAASLIIFLQLICSVISLFTVDFIGRRPLLLSAIAGCGLSLTFLSFYFLLDFYSKWVPLASMIVYVMSFNLGIANVLNCLNGELFSASIKMKAACVSAIFYSICVVVVTKLYQTLSDRLGPGVPILVFATAQLIGWCVCRKVVPETKGKTLEEIQQEIKGGSRVFEFEDSCQPLLQQAGIS